MDPRPAMVSWLQRRNKPGVILVAAAICGLATYIFCFHKVIFAVHATTTLLQYFLVKANNYSIADVCTLGYCYATILAGIYVTTEKVRTGQRPTWPINYEDDVNGFTAASVLMVISFKLCELRGRWGNLFDNLKIPAGMFVVIVCLGVTTARPGCEWLEALKAVGWFVVCGTVFDEAYQEECKNGTEIWPDELLPALTRGQLPGLWRKVNEERQRQKESQEMDDGNQRRKQDE